MWRGYQQPTNSAMEASVWLRRVEPPFEKWLVSVESADGLSPGGCGLEQAKRVAFRSQPVSHSKLAHLRACTSAALSYHVTSFVLIPVWNRPADWLPALAVLRRCTHALREASPRPALNRNAFASQ